MNKTIAVTGASGHIGNVLCRTLLAKGYRVRAQYYSNHKSLDGLALEIIKGDVMKEEDLTELMREAEVVIHCAAIISIHGDPDGTVFKTNTEGTQKVFQAAQKSGIKKMIHISSTHAVQEIPLSEIYTEDRPYKTVHDYSYDYSKAKSEQFLLSQCNSSAMEIIILRPSAVIGPYDFKPSELGKALISFYNRKIPVLPSGGYNFVDVRDVAESVTQAIEHGKNGEVYLLTGKYYSMKDLARLITKITGVKTPGLTLPFWFLKLLLPFINIYSKITRCAPLFTIESITTLQNGHPQMDHSKATRYLNHCPRAFENTLADFYAWKNNNLQ